MRHVLIGLRAFGEAVFWGTIGGGAWGLVMSLSQGAVALNLSLLAAGFGLFVTLDELFIDGLVHISDLGSDYFQYDQQRHLLRGERTGVRYQLGARVKVRVVRVDIETAKIDFVLVDPAGRARAVEGEMPHTVPVPVVQKPRDQDKKHTKLDTRSTDGPRKKRK